MADLGEILNSSNPQALQQLLALRGQLSSQQPSPTDLNALMASIPPTQQDNIARNINSLASTTSAPVSNSTMNALPWGGLTGAQLDQAIQKNPGPEASIGFNPSAKQALGDASLPSDDADEEEAPAAKKSASPDMNKAVQAAMASQSPSSQDTIGSLMDKLYGPGANDRLQNAQQAQRDILSTNAMSMAGKEIAAAMSRGGYKPNYESNQAIQQAASIPVQQEMQKRAAAGEALDQGIKLSDFQDKEQTRDPNSTISQAGRSVLSTYLPSLAKSPNFQSLDYEGIKNLVPFVDMKLKTELMQSMYANRQDASQDKASNAADMKLSAAVQQMNSQRGAAGFANRTTQLADRAISMANNYTPDQNDLTKQQVLSLYKDADQVMSGGVATEHGMEQIFPNTYKSSLDNLVQQVTNAPTGADMKPFVQQIAKQMQLMKDEAQSFKHDRAAELMMGYKHTVHPDIYSQYQKKLGLSDSDLNPQDVQANTPAPGAHPDDKSMLDWAQKNMNNPDPTIQQRAMMIAQMNMQGAR